MRRRMKCESDENVECRVLFCLHWCMSTGENDSCTTEALSTVSIIGRTLPHQTRFDKMLSKQKFPWFLIHLIFIIMPTHHQCYPENLRKIQLAFVNNCCKFRMRLSGLTADSKQLRLDASLSFMPSQCGAAAECRTWNRKVPGWASAATCARGYVLHSVRPQISFFSIFYQLSGSVI